MTFERLGLNEGVTFKMQSMFVNVSVVMKDGCVRSVRVASDSSVQVC